MENHYIFLTEGGTILALWWIYGTIYLRAYKKTIDNDNFKSKGLHEDVFYRPYKQTYGGSSIARAGSLGLPETDMTIYLRQVLPSISAQPGGPM